MNIDLSFIRRGFIAVALSFGFQAAQAATIGVVVYNPDLTTSSATLDYDFTAYCLGDDGGATSGLCGTDNGQNGQNKVTYDGTLDVALSSGVLTVSGASQILDAYDTGFDFITGGSSYSLIANFDGSGIFVDGTVSALGIALSGDLNFQSGTIVTGDLTVFGYGGSGSAGTFDFLFDNVGGDFAAFYTSYAGIVINTTTLSSASGNWDTGGLDFQADFSATSVNVDTTVPVPAAIWLFGSGLFGLAGWAKTRRQT